MNTKYEFVPGDEVVTARGHTLKRIRALADMPEIDVNAGDLGGYIESESNLSTVGTAWVYDRAQVYDRARVYDGARVFDGAQVYGGALVYGGAEVFDGARVFDGAQVSKTPVYLSGLRWAVTITDNVMIIGCQAHSFEAWSQFSDEAIREMDSNAPSFWSQHKTLLLGLATTRMGLQ